MAFGVCVGVREWSSVCVRERAACEGVFGSEYALVCMSVKFL